MALALYSNAILRLATSLVHDDRLEHPAASADVRAPLCGSRISADIALDQAGILQQIALRANACALGQASAAILIKYATGNTRQSIQHRRDALSDFLLGGSAGNLDWPELNEFAIARDYPARHGAILLPYDAVLAAFEKAA